MEDRGEGPGPLAPVRTRAGRARVLRSTAMGLATGTVFALACGAGGGMVGPCLQIVCALAGFVVGLRGHPTEPDDG